jgi:glycerol kinase
MSELILSIDQGTTSSRAIVFDASGQIVSSSQSEFEQHFPSDGWVEHDANEIISVTFDVCRQALKPILTADRTIAAIGITNQRETVVVWDRKTGQPIHRAIVWQDRRTAALCHALKSQGLEADVNQRTGLLLDPYFSATKIAWILENVEGAAARARNGELAFGTIDSWLIWNLTGGARHVTDATNAARTMVYNIANNEWDSHLLDLFGIPLSMMPTVLDSADDFGVTDKSIFGMSLAIRGVAGDQQAATVGQACFQPGMLKSTYGTGCFALLNTGQDLVYSTNRLLTTIAYRLNGQTTYALEGSIFMAGASVQWLRDGLGVIKSADQSDQMALAADPNQPVYLVPAFVGLGAPYWDPDVRGAMFGLTRNTGANELVRATLESVGYQTRDLLEAMRADWPGATETVLRVDGGMVASDWTMQFLADTLAAPVDRPTVLETTALGAAWLAGQHSGVWPDMAAFSAQWNLDRRFTPAMSEAERDKRYAGWSDAVRRTLTVSTQ